MQDVLHVPNLAANLISVPRLVDRGLIVTFNRSHCLIEDATGRLLCKGQRRGNLFLLEDNDLSKGTPQAMVSVASSGETWHKRLGHISLKRLKEMEGKDMVRGLKLEGSIEDMVCEHCLHGKQKRFPFKEKSGRRATRVLELVHSDVCGPMEQNSLGGAMYFVTFIDDFSRKCYVYLLRKKSDVLRFFLEFLAMAERESGKKLKTLRTDNGGEFQALAPTLRERGIKWETSAPYTPQQNGVAERFNRTIVEMSRSMLHHSGLPKTFWAEAVRTAVYIINVTPTTAMEGKTPQEAWSGVKPSVAHMRTFGCMAHAHVPAQRRQKWDGKSAKCIFLGYESGSKAYRLYDPVRKVVLKSRDVIFEEGKHFDSNVADSGPIDSSTVSFPNEDDSSHSQPLQDPGTHVEQPGEDGEQTETPRPIPAPRRSTRVRIQPQRLTYLASNEGPSSVGDVEDLEEVARAFHVSVDDPHNVNEALGGRDARKWKKAMEEEMTSIRDNGTWSLVDLPKGHKAVGCKWIFRVKKDAHGEVQRYKARLVAKGFSQIQGMNFDETFSPVAKFATIRTVLALAAVHGWEIHQMDVKTAFLNGDIDHEVYMQQPEGFVEHGSEGKVCKLHKSIYGLKQSPRLWYKKLHDFLCHIGFERLHADPSAYRLVDGAEMVIMIIYVDDLILCSKSAHMLVKLKEQLSSAFRMTDMGDLHFYLGMEVIRDREGGKLLLNQQKYIHNVLERFGMQDSKPVETPMATDTKLTRNMAAVTIEEKEEMENIPYQSAVGSLMYAMVCTRPDLAFSVGATSRYLSAPGKRHWEEVKRTLRYLRGTSSLGLQFGGKGEVATTLVGYTDADWAGDLDDRKSTCGYVFILGGAAISWKSKKQASVALSSTQAEYMALSEAGKEAVWLRGLLKELGQEQSKPTVIFNDNISSQALAENPVYHDRSKHIDIRYHFIRELVETKVVDLEHLKTKAMVADVMTKPQPKDRHKWSCDRMGMAAK
jgi:transposase InsO family protein